MGTCIGACYGLNAVTGNKWHYEPTTLQDVVQCPESGRPLIQDGAFFRTADGDHEYAPRDGIPDLQRPPRRFAVDVPWFEPWAALDSIRSDAPEPLEDPSLPYHLDPYQWAVFQEHKNLSRVLEVGCGERQMENFLVPRGYAYVGMDVDHRGPGPNVFGDAHNLPFKDDTFDIVVSMAVYQHLCNPIQAAREAYRVTRPGGLYMATAAFVYGWTDRASFFHMSHAGLLMILTYAGFENIRVWSDWEYSESIPNMSFSTNLARPWKRGAELTLSFLEWSYRQTAEASRKVAGRPPLAETGRDLKTAGSLTFVATKPSAAER